eukprot:scaffold13021_cov127-Isochrysis_galbana.AAC.2
MRAGARPEERSAHSPLSPCPRRRRSAARTERSLAGQAPTCAPAESRANGAAERQREAPARLQRLAAPRGTARYPDTCRPAQACSGPSRECGEAASSLARRCDRRTEVKLTDGGVRPRVPQSQSPRRVAWPGAGTHKSDKGGRIEHL